jgi:hypothetical protein
MWLAPISVKEGKMKKMYSRNAAGSSVYEKDAS